MKWWERTEQLLRTRGMTPADLARASGVGTKLVYKYLDGKVENPRGDTLKKLADALSTSEQFLRYGVPPSVAIELKRIPLLTLRQIGGLQKGRDPREIWDGVSVVSVPKDVEDQAFGVALDGDESNSPEIGPRDILILEPNAPRLPGRYVLAIAQKMKRGFIGRYRPARVDSDDEFKVVPGNPDYPPVEIGQGNPGFLVARATKHIREI